eukprot:PhM_4_TR3014/c1_g1_i1/m.89461
MSLSPSPRIVLFSPNEEHNEEIKKNTDNNNNNNNEKQIYPSSPSSSSSPDTEGENNNNNKAVAQRRQRAQSSILKPMTTTPSPPPTTSIPTSSSASALHNGNSLTTRRPRAATTTSSAAGHHSHHNHNHVSGSQSPSAPTTRTRPPPLQQTTASFSRTPSSSSSLQPPSLSRCASLHGEDLAVMSLSPTTARATVAQLRRELQERDQQLEQAAALGQELVARIKTLHDTIEGLERDIDAQREENTQLHEQYALETRRLEQENQTLRHYELTHSDIARERDELRRSVAELRAKVEVLEAAEQRVIAQRFVQDQARKMTVIQAFLGAAGVGGVGGGGCYYYGGASELGGATSARMHHAFNQLKMLSFRRLTARAVECGREIDCEKKKSGMCETAPLLEGVAQRIASLEHVWRCLRDRYLPEWSRLSAENVALSFQLAALMDVVVPTLERTTKLWKDKAEYMHTLWCLSQHRLGVALRGRVENMVSDAMLSNSYYYYYRMKDAYQEQAYALLHDQHARAISEVKVVQAKLEKCDAELTRVRGVENEVCALRSKVAALTNIEAEALDAQRRLAECQVELAVLAANLQDAEQRERMTSQERDNTVSVLAAVQSRGDEKEAAVALAQGWYDAYCRLTFELANAQERADHLERLAALSTMREIEHKNEAEREQLEVVDSLRSEIDALRREVKQLQRQQQKRHHHHHHHHHDEEQNSTQVLLSDAWHRLLEERERLAEGVRGHDALQEQTLRALSVEAARERAYAERYSMNMNINISSPPSKEEASGH